MIFTGIGIVAAFSLISFYNSRQTTAGLKVETNPSSLVFVDNIQIGQTPVEKTFSPKEVTVKIIPSSVSQSFPTYQTQVVLSDKVYTVIRRDFGSTELESAGETVTLVPQPGSTASLSVNTSSPDYATLTLDGQPQGLTPLSILGISPGTHQLVVSAPGYTTRTISAQALAGYKLTISIKLAGHPADLLPSPTPLPASASATLVPVASSSATPKPALPTPSVPSVRILTTPTGFLRVRSGPGVSYSEVGQVKPGEIYPFTDARSGWYLVTVSLPATSSGWISSDYAQKL